MTAKLKRIICVDDERDILDVARMCLEVVGRFSVVTFDNGKDAIVHAEIDPPDMILLDVMMPGLNGPETFAAMREIPALKDVPVVFVTARAQPAEIRSYMRLGVTAVIPKPFDPMKLAGEVQMIFNAHHEAHEAMAVSEAEVAAQMAPLRARYIDELPQYMARLDNALTYIAAGGLTPEGRGALKGVAHKLAGTGKTYGFPALSAAARKLDDYLMDARADDVDIAGMIAPILNACKVACSISTKPAPTGGRKTFGRKDGPAVVTSAEAAAAFRPTVLIADDDRTVRGLFSELLASEANILEAVNSNEALRLMRLHRPDMVLLDDIMPGAVTGLKLLEILQQSGEFNDTPIIMITASDADADIYRGFRAGAADYITKPFDVATVIPKLRARLRGLKGQAA